MRGKVFFSWTLNIKAVVDFRGKQSKINVHKLVISGNFTLCTTYITLFLLIQRIHLDDLIGSKLYIYRAFIISIEFHIFSMEIF